jgi:hypothetical protein
MRTCGIIEPSYDFMTFGGKSRNSRQQLRASLLVLVIDIGKHSLQVTKRRRLTEQSVRTTLLHKVTDSDSGPFQPFRGADFFIVKCS